MPGLVQNAMQGMQPAEQAPAGPASPDTMEQPAPEDQAKYETLVLNAIEYIHGEARDQVLSRMQSGRPEEAVGKIAADIGLANVELARASGIDLDMGLLLQAGNEVVAELAELGEAAGLFEADQNFVERALYVAGVLYMRGAEAKGWITEEDKASMMGAMGMGPQAPVDQGTQMTAPGGM